MGKLVTDWVDQHQGEDYLGHSQAKPKAAIWSFYHILVEIVHNHISLLKYQTYSPFKVQSPKPERFFSLLPAGHSSPTHALGPNTLCVLLNSQFLRRNQTALPLTICLSSKYVSCSCYFYCIQFRLFQNFSWVVSTLAGLLSFLGF